jgi:uncharacterized 2Fe-2S/4Fe-4S cluster protein (DUF4445 family)
MLGVAVDIGTTTLAASLVDLGTGARLAEAGRLNPQRPFGADVVSRLEAALRSPEEHREMTRLINESLEGLAAELLERTGRGWGELSRLALAGNPTMEHLLLGLPVESLAFPPYRPLFASGRTVATAELGWSHDLPAEIFPLPGGFVGGDLVAFLYGVRDWGLGTRDSGPMPFPVPSPQSPVPTLYLDLGTNGEIALAAGRRLYATAAAAGPAFEGGNLSCGMAALDGAISGVSLARGSVQLTTVGGSRPVGVCGSGVLEAVAELLHHGVLDCTGRLLPSEEIPSNLANRVTETGGERAFVLYRDARATVSLTQGDIRQVQLAKAAVRGGMEVLCERAGITMAEIASVVLTGSFGARISVDSLKRNGILTENMVHVTGFVPEGALRGAERALSLPGGLDEVEALAAGIRVIPLSGTPLFEKHFFSHMDFPA